MPCCDEVAASLDAAGSALALHSKIVCMCVCVFMCVYVCACVCMCVCAFARVRVRMFVCAGACGSAPHTCGTDVAHSLCALKSS